jgi:hypothetical protein
MAKVLGPKRSVYVKENLIAAVQSLKRIKETHKKESTIYIDDVLRVEVLLNKVRRAVWRGPSEGGVCNCHKRKRKPILARQRR